MIIYQIRKSTCRYNQCQVILMNTNVSSYPIILSQIALYCLYRAIEESVKLTTPKKRPGFVLFDRIDRLNQVISSSLQVIYFKWMIEFSC